MIAHVPVQGVEAGMHPRDYFDNFWTPNLRDEVFVAMSFEPSLAIVWDKIIRPAIQSVKLEACRVDASQISGDILSQIMSGIADARLVVGDLTGVLTHANDPGRRSPSTNVMYEIGLAHAVRQEPEVLLIAAKGSSIPFDISVARIHFYDPDELDESSRTLAHWIRAALAEVDLRKQLKVEAAVRALDRGCLRFLKCYRSQERFPKQTFAEKVRQIVATLPAEAQPGVIEAERRDFPAGAFGGK